MSEMGKEIINGLEAYKESITPISDRTDESLVRTIAEWMGFDANTRDQWLDTHGLAMNDGGYRWFCPHTDPCDRERVDIALPDSVTCKGYDHQDGTYGFDVVEIEAEFLSTVVAPTLGRAFIEAVVAWIEAQK